MERSIYSSNIRKTKVEKVSNWRDDVALRAYRLCLLGLNNADLALAFGLSTFAIENKLRNDPKFRDAVERGRSVADAKVASALYKRATGYMYTDTHVTVYKPKDGEPTVITTPVIKFQAPDTGAAIFWLTNRQPDYWSNSMRLEHTGGMTVKHEPLDLSDLDTDELNLLKKVGLQKMLNANN